MAQPWVLGQMVILSFWQLSEIQSAAVIFVVLRWLMQLNSKYCVQAAAPALEVKLPAADPPVKTWHLQATVTFGMFILPNLGTNICLIKHLPYQTFAPELLKWMFTLGLWVRPKEHSKLASVNTTWRPEDRFESCSALGLNTDVYM